MEAPLFLPAVTAVLVGILIAVLVGVLIAVLILGFVLAVILILVTHDNSSKFFPAAVPLFQYARNFRIYPLF